jgi:hypothetical protein
MVYRRQRAYVVIAMPLATHFTELDRVLRGKAQIGSQVRSSHLAPLIVLLGMTYGLCMGCFAVVSGRAGTWKQLISSSIKVPALFLLTLAITFPSLYVFGALVDSSLTLRTTLRLIMAALAVMLAVLASFGTIVAFFSFTTESHAFMALLNVAVFGMSGVLGMTYLMRMLRTLTGEQAAEGVEQRPPVKRVFVVWVMLFALVGAQMSWIMRPFIGGQEGFAIFRARGSNFFEAVWGLAGKLIG